MPEFATVSITADGCRHGGQSWQPAGPWLGLLTDDGDPRSTLLASATASRNSRLDLVSLVPDADVSPDACLELLAAMPGGADLQGLLLGEAWQGAAAARCDTLTGAAADLGLADAIRRSKDGAWQGHHLLAGALEAFLAQTWPDEEPPGDRAVVLGAGSGGLAAALAIARRGVRTIQLVVPVLEDEADLAARVLESTNWSIPTEVLLVDRWDPDPDPAGFWVRMTNSEAPANRWLPDAAGNHRCLLLDVVGRTPAVPVGFAYPAADSVHVIAAGLAVAWYLGPPIPWDVLRSSVAD